MTNTVTQRSDASQVIHLRNRACHTLNGFQKPATLIKAKGKTTRDTTEQSNRNPVPKQRTIWTALVPGAKLSANHTSRKPRNSCINSTNPSQRAASATTWRRCSCRMRLEEQGFCSISDLLKIVFSAYRPAGPDQGRNLMRRSSTIVKSHPSE